MVSGFKQLKGSRDLLKYAERSNGRYNLPNLVALEVEVCLNALLFYLDMISIIPGGYHHKKKFNYAQ